MTQQGVFMLPDDISDDDVNILLTEIDKLSTNFEDESDTSFRQRCRISFLLITNMSKTLGYMIDNLNKQIENLEVKIGVLEMENELKEPVHETE